MKEAIFRKCFDSFYIIGIKYFLQFYYSNILLIFKELTNIRSKNGDSKIIQNRFN